MTLLDSPGPKIGIKCKRAQLSFNEAELWPILSQISLPWQRWSIRVDIYDGGAENARLENAELENPALNHRGGKRETGKRGNLKVMESRRCRKS